MGMNYFSARIADATCRATHAPLSDTGNRPPQVFFRLIGDGAFIRAEPQAAVISCEANAKERESRVTIRDKSGAHVADVTVHVPGDADLTEETIAVASALYWSWWRALDMRGELPEVSP